MNLYEVMKRIETRADVPLSRVRGLRSSVQRYGILLGCASLEQCEESNFALPKNERHKLIEKGLPIYYPNAKSGAARNIKNDVGFVLRKAQELKLISPIDEGREEIATGRFKKRKVGKILPAKVRREKVALLSSQPYSLPYDYWSIELRTSFDDWRRVVTASNAPSGHTGHHQPTRPATVLNKKHKLEAYFGFIKHTLQIENIDFKMLADFESLAAYVKWLRARRPHAKHVQARDFLSIASSIIRNYLVVKAAKEGSTEDASKYAGVVKRISVLRREIEEVTRPRYKATDIGHTSPEIDAYEPSYRELLKVACAEFPMDGKSRPGLSEAELAACAGRAIALLLLLYHPLRNKNYREAWVSSNSIKTPVGRWHLRFKDPTAMTFGQTQSQFNGVNVYDLPLNEQITKYLDKYLSVWRPTLLRKLDQQISQAGSASSQRRATDRRQRLARAKNLLLLNSKGTEFSQQKFSLWIQTATYRWLGVRVSPRQLSEIATDELSKRTSGLQHITDLRPHALLDVELARIL
jgi:hypothetical protein